MTMTPPMPPGEGVRTYILLYIERHRGRKAENETAPSGANVRRGGTIHGNPTAGYSP